MVVHCMVCWLAHDRRHIRQASAIQIARDKALMERRARRIEQWRDEHGKA